MTRLEALKELAAKVEAGVDIYPADFPSAFRAVPRAVGAYYGSLDAAKALHEAVLPGWWWKVGTCRVSDDACVSPEGPASVMSNGTEWADLTDVDMRPPGNPARAWLLAILRAFIAMEEAA